MHKAGVPVEGKIRHHARGKCVSCYNRKGPYNGTVRKLVSFDDFGQTCTKCLEYLPYDQFDSHRVARSGFKSWCKKCVRASIYGLSKFQYAEILDSQGGTCAICPRTPEDNTKALAVDHDHTCCPGIGSCGKCVRGILCSDCNRAIGLLQDSPELILNAYQYIMKETNGENN